MLLVLNLELILLNVCKCILFTVYRLHIVLMYNVWLNYNNIVVTDSIVNLVNTVVLLQVCDNKLN